MATEGQSPFRTMRPTEARLRAALSDLINAASSMPDAGLADGDPRRAWWFDVLVPARDRAKEALR